MRAADEIASLVLDRARRGLMAFELRLLGKQIDFFDAMSRQVEALTPRG